MALYVGGSVGLVLYVGALADLDAERGAKGATIETFGDSLWWAMTVGYGDEFAVTQTGRFVAAALMLAGIALLGVVTASLASWLIERVSQVEEESQAATRRDMAALAAGVRALREDVADLTGERGRSGSARP